MGPPGKHLFGIGLIGEDADGAGGIVGTAVAFAREKTGHLRIDTHEDNKVMQHVVEKMGFSRRGIIYVADGSPRIAYEMV